VSDFTRDRFEVLMDLLGSIPPLRKEVKLVRMISEDEECAEDGIRRSSIA